MPIEALLSRQMFSRRRHYYAFFADTIEFIFAIEPLMPPLIFSCFALVFFAVLLLPALPLRLMVTLSSIFG